MGAGDESKVPGTIFSISVSGPTPGGVSPCQQHCDRMGGRHETCPRMLPLAVRTADTVWEERAKGKRPARHPILRKSGLGVRGPGFKPHIFLWLSVTSDHSLPLLTSRGLRQLALGPFPSRVKSDTVSSYFQRLAVCLP